jgi:para-nitrobenzyl esterase
VNFRLGSFGSSRIPALTAGSPMHASGIYTCWIKSAALPGAKKHLPHFGGESPAGHDCGGIRRIGLVSARNWGSPAIQGLIAGAIGESGSIIGTLPATPLAEGEARGVKFAAGLGLGENPTLAQLRAIPAADLLEATAKQGVPRLGPVVDGYFFPKAPADIFASGEQAHVPLLAGSNSEESGYGSILGREQPTVENYRKATERLYGEKAGQVLKLYPATNEEEVKNVARDLAGDRFISLSTWKWVDLATKTGGKPTWYYLYARPRPATVDAVPNASRPTGAVHSAEIEYALGNLDLNKVYAWSPDDRKVSQIMQDYFANFIKTGNPNGPGLPEWPTFASGQRQIIDVNTRAEKENVRERYEFSQRIEVEDSETG